MDLAKDSRRLLLGPGLVTVVALLEGGSKGTADDGDDGVEDGDCAQD